MPHPADPRGGRHRGHEALLRAPRRLYVQEYREADGAAERRG